MPEISTQIDVLEKATMDQLLALDEGAYGLIQEMYQLFLEDFQGRMDAIQRALDANNQEELGEVAHAVKGAASTMGANRVRAIAAALEAAARKGVTDTPPAELFRQLKLHYQEALDALQAFIALGTRQ
jgi:HPt (histidine-containing phosphotransfer) domain-containing protein